VAAIWLVPSLIPIVTADGFSEDDVLRLVAAAERESVTLALASRSRGSDQRRAFDDSGPCAPCRPSGLARPTQRGDVLGVIVAPRGKGGVQAEAACDPAPTDLRDRAGTDGDAFVRGDVMTAGPWRAVDLPAGGPDIGALARGIVL